MTDAADWVVRARRHGEVPPFLIRQLSRPVVLGDGERLLTWSDCRKLGSYAERGLEIPIRAGASNGKVVAWNPDGRGFMFELDGWPTMIKMDLCDASMLVVTAPAKTAAPAPIPMLIWCPDCRVRHVDAGEFATKPHHTHACQACGCVWRPAIEPTVGVQFLPGFVDDPAGNAGCNPIDLDPEQHRIFMAGFRKGYAKGRDRDR